MATHNILLWRRHPAVLPSAIFPIATSPSYFLPNHTTSLWPRSPCHPFLLFLNLQSLSCQAGFLFPLYPKVHSTYTPSVKFSSHYSPSELPFWESSLTWSLVLLFCLQNSSWPLHLLVSPAPSTCCHPQPVVCYPACLFFPTTSSFKHLNRSVIK